MPLHSKKTNGENENKLPQKRDRRLSREVIESRINSMYGDFDYSLDNTAEDGRPVFNYQNPDFCKRRRRFSIETPSPSTSFVSPSKLGLSPVSIELDEYPIAEITLDEEPVTRSVLCDDSELVNRHHRTTSIHRNATFREISDPSCRTMQRTLEERRHWMAPAGNKKQNSIVEVEEHANNIANRMQQDGSLMEANPESELLRKEALRDMPQCLTVKRMIKRKLKSSVSLHSKHNPISCGKRLQYYLSMKITKIENSLKSFSYSTELWYSSLKKIEGHFGSGVATYFRFLRWLFAINCCISLGAVVFIILPQLLFTYIGQTSEVNGTYSNTLLSNTYNSFKIQHIFDGEGYFTNTVMYYGFYTTRDIVLVPYYLYHMPYAYFLTMISLYFVSFCVLSARMAKSYRRSFIKTQGGLKNVYAHKIFCGWDYSIATEDGAKLKSSSIYHELKELISDSEKPPNRGSFWKVLWTYTIQITINIFVVALLIGIGYVMWILLESHSIENNTKEAYSNVAIITAVLINVIMIAFPMIFGAIIRCEDYKHPRAALYITLIRTFLLKSVVLGVFIGFWLTHSDVEECWETSIGQHIYRLILFDFLFSLILGTVVHITRFIIYKKCTRKFGIPEFDIAQHTLQLLYNQTLFWVGFYFSPILSVIVVIKLWCTWYLRRSFVLYICKSSAKAWRAAQTETVFLILSFLSLMLVVIAHGYIIVGVKTSNCGPLRDYPFMYEMIIRDIFKLEQDHKFWRVLLYLKKPGTVALIFVAMGVTVYYLRAKAKAQKDIVKILRQMLVLEAKDKEFLLEYISKVTDGKLPKKLEKGTTGLFENANVFSVEVEKPLFKEDIGDSGTSSASSIALLK